MREPALKCNRDPLQAEPSDARPHRIPLGVAVRQHLPELGVGVTAMQHEGVRVRGHELVEELVRPQIFLLVDHLAELMRNRMESSAGQKWQRFRELRDDSVVVQVAMRRYVPTRLRHSQGWVNQRLGSACVEGVEHESNRG